MIIPVIFATTSPYLAYRGPIYILAGFAGIIAMSLLLLQPLLSLPPRRIIAVPAARRWHRIVGTSIIVLVLVHVGGLYVVSPPDTLDALMLRAPTLFSLFGVAAFWGCVLTASLAITRRKLPLRPTHWKRLHQTIASAVAIATVIHAVQIEGAMEPITKAGLGGAIILATVFVAVRRRTTAPRS
jgi:hypothetical protein